MSKDKSIPAIRFEKFESEWKNVTLNSITDVRDGTHDSPRYQPEGHPFVTSKNVKDGYINYDDIQYISTSDFHIINNRSKVDKHDILMGMIGTIGNIALVRKEPDFAIKNVALIKNTGDINHLFLYHFLQSPYVEKQLEEGMDGGTQKFISLDKIRRLKTSLPTVEEQKLIGEYMEQIENYIIHKKHELSKLNQYKQAMLQKMFPKEGETVPEVRFDGFEGEWKNTTLGDVAEIHGGGTPSTSIPEYWNGDIDWYAPAEINEQIFVSKSQKTITEFGLQKSSTKILPVGTVLFTSRAGIGKTAVLAKEGTTNQGFQSIVPNKNQLDSYFIYARTNELKRYGEEKGAGSTFVEVSGKQMAKMPIRIPSLKEQKRIGEYFQALDNNIQSKQSELNKLKQFKQAMLDKMFV